MRRMHQRRLKWSVHLFAIALAGCGAALWTAGCGVEGSECRAHDDCADGLFCRGPNAKPVCGIPVRMECAADSGCIDGVCHAIDDPCSPIGIGTRCGSPCPSDTTCGPGFRCDTARGACEPVPCDDGGTCPAPQVCDPSAKSATHHGCVDVACSSDSACSGAQACVNGRCQEGVGFCREDQAVP